MDPSKSIVLIVDDEPLLLRVFKSTLKNEPYRCEFASNPYEALRVISNNGFMVKLMVTDYQLPGATGLELAEKAQSLNPGIKIIFMSGGDAPVPESRILNKPFSVFKLKQRIRDELGLVNLE
jgi:CheY-like chemotaxis protein